MESEYVKIFTPFQIKDNHFHTPQNSNTKYSPFNSCPVISCSMMKQTTQNQATSISKKEWNNLFKYSSDQIKANHCYSIKIRNEILRGVSPDLYNLMQEKVFMEMDKHK